MHRDSEFFLNCLFTCQRWPPDGNHLEFNVFKKTKTHAPPPEPSVGLI